MKRTPLRTRAAAAALLLLAAVAWHYLAPTEIGGSTRYVITNGTSMEPRFHTGDLAIVRPADHYAAGEIVAYRSRLLKIAVLHRIVAERRGHYVFKGDHNSFLDPIHPAPSQLLGKLWLHIPHGGFVLASIHKPLTAAILVAVVTSLMVFGAGETRRRRRRRRGASTPESGGKGAVAMGAPDRTAWPPIGPRAILLGAAVVGALCFGLCVLGFTRPTHKPVSSQIPFTQRVIFDYHAAAHAGLIYPDGVLRTGDPIFVRLVHRIAFEAQYGFTTRASHELSGTKQLSLDVMGPGGWSRSLPLGPRQRFTGTNATMQVTLDLDRVQSLIDRVQSVTGMTLGSGYTVALVPDVRISGTLAGQPIKTAFKPPLTLTFNGLQLQPSLGSASSSGSESGFTARKSAAVSAAGSAPATLTVLGHRMGVGLLRWIGLIGLLLAGLAVLVAALLKRAEPFEEAARIQAEFGHLIVPILVESDDLGWPPVDVPSIKALVRLAESGQCLILHRDDPGGDTYLVNDAGTVYRYQVKPGNVVWGEWKPARPRPLNATSAPDADDLSAQSSSA